MAVKLNVGDTRLQLKTQSDLTAHLRPLHGKHRMSATERRVPRLKAHHDTYDLKASVGIAINANYYTGATEVTPTQEEQVLLTRNLIVPDHIKVNPIPSNYGLITYNGSIITVS